MPPHTQREPAAAPPPSPSVSINSPRDRTLLESPMLTGAAVRRCSPCVGTVVTQADELRSRRTTILPSLCVKRQQLNKLKQHESHHAQVGEDHQQMSCSTRASRASVSWSGAPDLRSVERTLFRIGWATIVVRAQRLSFCEIILGLITDPHPTRDRRPSPVQKVRPHIHARAGSMLSD